jgi:hypothetical protein
LKSLSESKISAISAFFSLFSDSISFGASAMSWHNIGLCGLTKNMGVIQQSFAVPGSPAILLVGTFLTRPM